MSGSSSRRWLAFGALLTVVGLGLAAMSPVAGSETSAADRVREIMAGVGVLAGWLVLGWGIHRFARD